MYHQVIIATRTKTCNNNKHRVATAQVRGVRSHQICLEILLVRESVTNREGLNTPTHPFGTSPIWENMFVWKLPSKLFKTAHFMIWKLPLLTLVRYNLKTYWIFKRKHIYIFIYKTQINLDVYILKSQVLKKTIIYREIRKT